MFTSSHKKSDLWNSDFHEKLQNTKCHFNIVAYGEMEASTFNSLEKIEILTLKILEKYHR